MIKLYLLILLSNTTNVDKIKSIYYLNTVEEVRITCAIIRYETGHLNCHTKKIICSLNYNNLFGFRKKNDYLKFNNRYESILYYINWQNKYWLKYKRKHNKDYYSFLKWLGYCNNMNDYIKVIKQIERL